MVTSNSRKNQIQLKPWEIPKQNYNTMSDSDSEATQQQYVQGTYLYLLGMFLSLVYNQKLNLIYGMRANKDRSRLVAAPKSHFSYKRAKNF